MCCRMTPPIAGARPRAGMCTPCWAEVGNAGGTVAGLPRGTLRRRGADPGLPRLIRDVLLHRSSRVGPERRAPECPTGPHPEQAVIGRPCPTAVARDRKRHVARGV